MIWWGRVDHGKGVFLVALWTGLVLGYLHKCYEPNYPKIGLLPPFAIDLWVCSGAMIQGGLELLSQSYPKMTKKLRVMVRGK